MFSGRIPKIKSAGLIQNAVKFWAVPKYMGLMIFETILKRKQKCIKEITTKFEHV